MINLQDLNNIDTQKMYQVYDSWPEIADSSYNKKLNPIDNLDIDHMVFAGMGGSGALGDIFASILSSTDIHTRIVKGYVLPKTVDANTLVVVTSVSGNTAETLQILDSAKEKKCKILGFSSGGLMERFCDKNNIEFRKIQQIHSPRASFTSFLYSMLRVLEEILPVGKKDVLESIKELNKQKDRISSSNLSQDNPALSLANWISGIPLIYHPWGLEASAIRFKNSLQENAKTHAITENVIEACHNGIVSWENQSNVQPILLQGKDDYIKTKERWSILKDYFEAKNIDFKEVYSIEGNILSKLICLIYFLDYTSIYLSIKNRIDPSPVESIDFIKKRV